MNVSVRYCNIQSIGQLFAPMMPEVFAQNSGSEAPNHACSHSSDISDAKQTVLRFQGLFVYDNPGPVDVLVYGIAGWRQYTFGSLTEIIFPGLNICARSPSG